MFRSRNVRGRVVGLLEEHGRAIINVAACQELWEEPSGENERIDTYRFYWKHRNQPFPFRLGFQ